MDLLRCQAALEQFKGLEWEQPLLIGIGTCQIVFLVRFLIFALYLARGRDAPLWMLTPEM